MFSCFVMLAPTPGHLGRPNSSNISQWSDVAPGRLCLAPSRDNPRKALELGALCRRKVVNGRQLGAELAQGLQYDLSNGLIEALGNAVRKAMGLTAADV